jgi:cytochrome P450
MQALSDINLPHLPVDTPEFAADPVRFFREAKRQHPWIAASDLGYWVHDYAAIRELLGHDETLRPAYDGIVAMLGAHGTPWGRFTEEQLISLPSETHARLRQTFATKFTPRYANQMRPIMQASIGDLLDEWAPKGAFDFEEFAANFPISVMFRLVGAPVEEIPRIRWALETHGLAFGMNPDHIPAVQEAVEVEDAFVQRIVAERRANRAHGGEQDLLDLLLEAAEEGSITDRQLYDVLIFVFVAGYDTSKNVLTYMMYLMMQNPEVYRRCAEDLEYCRKVVEETLRYYNPGTTNRFTNDEMDYRGVTLPRDTMVFFPLSISGRDPGTFEEPERFDPERTIAAETRHISFGLGKHICLGQYIARAQLQEGLHLIAQLIREP